MRLLLLSRYELSQQSSECLTGLEDPLPSSSLSWLWVGSLNSLPCGPHHRAICVPSIGFWASLVAQMVKNPPAMRETWVQSLGWEDPLEKGKATHSSILAWRIPWTVQFIGLQRVRHD